MKKIISTFLVIFTLTFTLPKPEAKAAVVAGTSMCMVDVTAVCVAGIFLVTPAISLGGIITGTVIAVSMSTPLGYWIMGAGIVLDAEGVHNGLAQSLTEKFSFIDDQQVIDELSAHLVQKFHHEKDLFLATLDEVSIREILESTDLSEEEVMTVVHELN